ncbi:WD40-repeat-containing domain protein [Blastocladiella britannica]|nr:WD40-repeat-containing domain protein [Blastocladiella britannica]
MSAKASSPRSPSRTTLSAQSGQPGALPAKQHSPSRGSQAALSSKERLDGRTSATSSARRLASRAGTAGSRADMAVSRRSLSPSKGALQESPEEDATPQFLFALPEALPADVPAVLPVFLSTATVELFQLKQLCPAEKPYTMLRRADLLADLFNRAAVSDFAPLKQQFNELPPEAEILIVADLEWKYGQNFVLCLTPESRSTFLTVPVKPNTPAAAAASDDALGGAGGKTPRRSGGWVSLGSDREIDDEKIVSMREPMFYRLTRKQRKFGQEYRFGDGDCNSAWIDIKPQPATAHTVRRMQLDNGTQAIPPTSERSAQTTWFRRVNASIQYEPLELETDHEQRVALDAVQPSLAPMYSRIEKVLMQNNVMNIFHNDLEHLGEEEQSLDQGTHSTLQEYQSFTDLKYSKEKSISWCAWHPTQKGVLAVSCVQRSTLDERIARGFAIRSKQSVVLLWSFFDPIHPMLVLEAAEDVACFTFHPHAPHLVAGGLVNGQIVIWDLSEYQDKMKTKKRDDTDTDPAPGGAAATPAAAATSAPSASAIGPKSNHVDVLRPFIVSNIEASHRASISDVAWLLIEVGNNGEPLGAGKPKTPAISSLDASFSSGVTDEHAALAGVTQFASTGLDGNVMFWDLMRAKKASAAASTLLSLPQQQNGSSAAAAAVTAGGGGGGGGGAALSLAQVQQLTTDSVWRPIFKVPLLSLDGTFDYGVTRFAIDAGATPRVSAPGAPPPPALPAASSSITRVWCATEEGDVIQADWAHDPSAGKAVSDGEKVSASRVDLSSGIHYGPVGDVLRSPHFSDILLSVGGWSAAIWADHIAVPLLSSAVGTTHVTCGCWSPTRPGVYFVGRADGFVEIWDVLDRTHAPSQVQAVCSTSVTAISVQSYYSKGNPTHQFIGVGDDDGTVHVLEVPRNIFRPGKNEKAIIRALLDREIKRVAFSAERRVFRAQEKQRAAEPKDPASEAKDDPKARIPLEGDALEKMFLDMQTSVLETLNGAE